MPVAQYRNFTITAFHDFMSPVDWESGSSLRRTFRHVAFALEHTEDGRPHLQGFASAWHPTSMRKAIEAVQGQWPSAHVEHMKGSYVVSEHYCSKENRMHEYGIKPNDPGVKTTVLEYKRKLDDGERVDEVATDEKYFPTYLQYRNGLTAYQNHVRAKRVKNDRSMPLVYIRIGDAGTGKTRWCDEHFGIGNWVFAPDNKGQWFDGCDSSDVVVFDDVEVGSIPPLSLWKRLTDRYPMQVPVKGGFITWKPRAIVFTSNYPPSEWWPNLTQFDRNAIERRCTEVVVVE